MGITTKKEMKAGRPLWLSNWEKEAHFASLHVRRGSLWLTSKKSGRETIVTPGEDWAWDGKEDWLVEALADTSVELALIGAAA
jgi:hypothetical protein